MEVIIIDKIRNFHKIQAANPRYNGKESGQGLFLMALRIYLNLQDYILFI